jgi:hypothetical protein
VDLLLKLRGTLVPVEIKLGTAVPSTRHLELGMADLGLKRGYVVCGAGDLRNIRPGIQMGSLTAVLGALRLA